MRSLHILLTGLVMAGIPTIGLSAGPDFAGTTWQLVSIQSMNDQQGTTKIDYPSLFTLEFDVTAGLASASTAIAEPGTTS